MSARLLLAVGVTALFVLACNALTGADDLDFSGPGGGGPGSIDGAVDGDRPSLDGGGPGDVDAGPITASLASCGDAGERAVCLPNADGWLPVVSPRSGFDECPEEYPTPEPYQTTNGRCICDCASGNGSCEGTLTFRHGGSTCSGASISLGALPGDGGCAAMTFTPVPPVQVDLAPSGPAPTSCTASSRSTFPSTRAARVCRGATSTPSVRCAVREACFPRPRDGSMCIIRDGEVACPTNMAQRTVLGASFDDKRSCGPCTCSPSGCGTGGQITVHHNATCTQTYWNYDVDGKCVPGGASTEVKSVSYQASTGCSVATAPAILGTVSVTSPRTLCCTQL